jgi:hypothetical protein
VMADGRLRLPVSDRDKDVGERLDLLGERPVGRDHDDAVSAVFERLACPAILHLLAGVMRSVDEHAHPGDRTAPVVEIGLEEHIGRRGVLGEIGKAEVSFVKVVEKRTLE